jgi:beta-lactam-binding protein with PASTA domain
MKLRACTVFIVVGGVVLGLTGCSHSTANVTVPGSVAHADPLQATAALCAAGLHPLYVSAPALRHADVGYNGYAVKSANPAPGSSVQAGSVVDMVLVTDVNAGAIPRSRPAVVPSVIGLDVNKAVSEITERGLLVNVNAMTPTGSLFVTRQAPTARTAVRGRSTVTLDVGQNGSQGCP